ncbi:MAG: homoserine kinase [Jatrophihabitantaceae bacterium]
MPFLDRPVRVRVPATAANLGPGYDSFGLALSRYDEVTAAVTTAGLSIELAGDPADQLALDESHLVVRSMRACFELLGGQPSGLRLHCANRIPHGRGLGSSAAAIVAGVELARSLRSDGRQLLDDPGALALACELEGHPDNVAACLLGGLTVAWWDQGRGRGVRLDPVGFRPVVFIPPDRSATRAARAALPAQVPHSDAAFNVGRAGLLLLALTGRPELVLSATEDRLHQPYRASGMPASAHLVHELREQGIAAVISGAGPSVLALAVAEQAEQAAARCPADWECAVLSPAAGARAEALAIAK